MRQCVGRASHNRRRPGRAFESRTNSRNPQARRCVGQSHNLPLGRVFESRAKSRSRRMRQCVNRENHSLHRRDRGLAFEHHKRHRNRRTPFTQRSFPKPARQSSSGRPFCRRNVSYSTSSSHRRNSRNSRGSRLNTKPTSARVRSFRPERMAELSIMNIAALASSWTWRITRI